MDNMIKTRDYIRPLDNQLANIIDKYIIVAQGYVTGTDATNLEEATTKFNNAVKKKDNTFKNGLVEFFKTLPSPN